MFNLMMVTVGDPDNWESSRCSWKVKQTSFGLSHIQSNKSRANMQGREAVAPAGGDITRHKVLAPGELAAGNYKSGSPCKVEPKSPN